MTVEKSITPECNSCYLCLNELWVEFMDFKSDLHHRPRIQENKSSLKETEALCLICLGRSTKGFQPVMKSIPGKSVENNLATKNFPRKEVIREMPRLCSLRWMEEGKEVQGSHTIEISQCISNSVYLIG